MPACHKLNPIDHKRPIRLANPEAYDLAFRIGSIILIS